MNSEDIYRKHGQEVYLFILKRVKNQDIANDIFQSVFFKVHKNIGQLKTHQKSRGWVFQIGRNEIANYFNNESTYQDEEELVINDPSDLYADVCCFDRFINGLPDMYREVMVLTYISGKKQDEVAKALGISVANVKARVRRSKEMLKEKFQECCKYELNKEGKLVGASDCPTCS